MASERSKVSELQNNHLALSKQLSEAKTQELNHRRELVNFSDEMDEMRKKHTKEVMELEMDLRKKEREAREVTEDLRVTRNDLERERLTVENLRTAMSTQSQTQLTLSAENQALHAQLSSLQRQLESMHLEVADMKELVEEKEKAVIEMKKEVFESETIRRKLHNTILELKGNIRVFCRVRPVLPSDLPALPSPEEEERMREELKAKMDFPDNHDHKEIVLHSTSESAMGIERKDVYNFGFDRVFEPESTQAQVFEEISQLAQSCIDGYNVCIFAYGQTGSGKSFTMEGGPTDSTAGMIPRAVEQVFRVSEEMKSKGWEYKLEGQFLEIYNEAIHDLLIPSTAPDADKKKHDIKHDPKTGRTSVTEATVVPLQSPSQVRVLLTRAQSRRSVAATLMNERSSRSHSVFTLRISGVNVAGEKCEGCLNLVDLAGSERLNVSFGPGVTEKERVKETQSINKSLSALGDVISALGERGSSLSGKEVHIPYRNSKLTYLLQNSLSGSSKTLMVLNLSPLAAHMNESLTSLRFATKVNNTNIGTAKKLAKAS
ncbi:P-loop containing nucleoside triphosphate hydrolase protein [Ephemerocybe angulata]|uniref:P-loop containing nucleoside triphosphate hydrolase protein n=1 Tax=Ephemerocybe angulata TaxID=980116 RepID=A0A8H6I5X5_9AGAR|nr:P-loop containing nucleoside triphosphate hydrolase protein [Tulosesus angulatus]